MKRFGCLLAALTLTVAVCGAEGEAAARSEADYEACYALFEAAGTRSFLEAFMPAMAEQAMASAPEIASFEDVVMEFFNKYLGYDAVKQELADSFLDKFSPEEIAGLSEFYGTEAGRKVAEITAALPELFTFDELVELGEFYQSDLGRKVSSDMTGIAIQAGEIGQRRVVEHAEELKQMVAAKLLSGQNLPSFGR